MHRYKRYEESNKSIKDIFMDYGLDIKDVKKETKGK